MAVHRLSMIERKPGGLLPRTRPNARTTMMRAGCRSTDEAILVAYVDRPEDLPEARLSNAMAGSSARWGGGSDLIGVGSPSADATMGLPGRAATNASTRACATFLARLMRQRLGRIGAHKP